MSTVQNSTYRSFAYFFTSFFSLKANFSSELTQDLTFNLKNKNRGQNNVTKLVHLNKVNSFFEDLIL